MRNPISMAADLMDPSLVSTSPPPISNPAFAYAVVSYDLPLPQLWVQGIG